MTVARVEDHGSRVLVHAGLGRAEAGPYAFYAGRPAISGPGAMVELTWEPGRMRLFDAASGETIPV